MLLTLFIIGILASMPANLHIYRDWIGDKHAVPSYPQFALMCVMWPLSLLMYTVSSTWEGISFHFPTKTKPKLVIEPPKDRYLLDAEAEVEAFLGYSNTSEADTEKEFQAVMMAKNDYPPLPSATITHRDSTGEYGYIVDKWETYLNSKSFKDKAYASYIRKDNLKYEYEYERNMKNMEMKIPKFLKKGLTIFP